MSKREKMIATCRMRVQTDKGPIDIRAGEEVPVGKIPKAKLANLIARECMVPESALVHEGDVATSGTPAIGILDTPISKLGLQAQIVTALKGAGLSTVGDIAKYGEEHKTLTGIEGIDDPTEKTIQAAIKSLQTS